ncbi:hypothetical protein BN1723_016212, partial [Verticillium longisporum]
MKTSIKTSTSSMTAVPKPLKFLRPHYETLTKLQEDWPEGDDKTSLADVLSVIGMTFSDDERQDTLKYRLLAPSSDIISWGHEYSRHLALEIGEVYGKRIVADEDTKDLVDLALILVPTFLQSNGEADAVDLMSELEIIEQLPNYVDENTYARVCLYMVSMVNLLTYPDNELFLKTAHDIYITYKQYTQAMVLAIRLNDIDLIKADFDKAQDPALKKQLGFLCWGGFSRRAFSNWSAMLWLALPGMIMIQAEYMAFEVLTLFSSRFGASYLAAQSVLVTLTAISYQIPFPISIAASTRIANLIGAGLVDAAKTTGRLASFYHRDQESLFMVRIAQGLLHMGKGTMSVNPFHTDRQVLSRVSAGGILAVLVAMIDAKSFITSDSHYLLYFLVTAMHPRFLVTLGEDLKPLKVNVRVGQAVDVVGQAGRPKTITGWQTQSTPVVLAYGERAELEDEEYISLNSTLEGLVILKKNPDWEGAK